MVNAHVWKLFLQKIAMISRWFPMVVCLFINSFKNVAICQGNSLEFVLDMVHHNPGEPLTKSDFNSSAFLSGIGYNGKVVNDFVFPHAAILYKELNPAIFPEGTPAYAWVAEAASRIRKNIAEAHAAGLKVYYFSDFIVLPKRLVELYRNEICDSSGKISLERPMTIEIHRMMLREIFETFPDLDGLVIRTGETYTNNVPYHTGNNPITNGEKSHIRLLSLLREELCVKRNKLLIYRTWSFGGMHDDPGYYQRVTDAVEPHANLVFSVKHTKGDYHRTYDFNPTIGLGHHRQIVEVQCQREYEGKGAYPNYVMEGVINGFEEYDSCKPQQGNKCLNDLRDNKLLAGVWSWSRGGGWVGPYVSNELWPRLNAYVACKWALDNRRTEEEIFNEFMEAEGVEPGSRAAFRRLALLSAKAVLRGHSSVRLPFDSSAVFWMRDEFLSGIEQEAEPAARFPSEGFLFKRFQDLYGWGLLDAAVQEKYEAVSIWQEITALAKQVRMRNKEDEQYVSISSQYGLLLHTIIAEGWRIMALGFKGDRSGVYETEAISEALVKYDKAWEEYRKLKDTYASCATLYKPYAFVYQGPDYHLQKGMGFSVDRYRNLVRKGARGKGVLHAME